MEYDEFPAMNTTILVAAEGNREALEPGFKRVRDFIADCEARFSRFQQESELCQLNRSAGSWFQASPELINLLEEALELYHLTGGLFDPSILTALRNAGYDRSMDLIRESGSGTLSIEHQPNDSRFWQTRLDRANERIFLPSGVQVDLGGIAKGWIAERAVEILAEYSPACAVSAGGDMAFHGLPEGEPAWQVSLEDPRDDQTVIAVLHVRSRALVTSSINRRRWLQGDQARHHIIDPHTGAPAEAEWLSVSVGAPRATTAEAFAKAILIGGSGAATQLAGRIPGLWYVAVHADGSLCGTTLSKEMVYEPVSFERTT